MHRSDQGLVGIRGEPFDLPGGLRKAGSPRSVRETRQGFIDCRGTDGALFHRAKPMGEGFKVPRLERRGLLLKLQPGTVAVMPGLPRQHRHRLFQPHFADPFERFEKNALLQLQLALIADVLVLAAATAAKVGAVGSDPLRAGFGNMRQVPAADAPATSSAPSGVRANPSPP